jgi:DNA-binding SARP family transcriptional activator
VPAAYCRVLGPVEVTIDGQAAPADLLWRKHLALLVVLARSPSRKRSRTQLMLLLWGDKPDSAARQSLNEALRILRRRLGDDAVITRGDEVQLAEGAVELDANEVDRLLDAGYVSAATELIRGDFMDGFTVPNAWDFEEWLAAERRLWREHAVTALAEAATSALASGTTRGARTFAERALRLDPLCESAVRALMCAHALAGDRAAALNEFRRFTSELDRTYGIAPGSETEALAERIGAERSWDLPPAVPGLDSDATRSWPLVGRTRELQTLLDGWRACRAQRCTRLGVILGDPGMGKSRLAEELLARARLEGARTAMTRAVPGDEVMRWRGLSGLQGAGRAPSDGSSDPLRDLVDFAVPLNSPLMIVLDDAQYLDADSLRAVGALLRDALHRSVFLLLGVGPGASPELDALLARVGRDVDGDIVRMEPLDASAVGELVCETLPEFAGTEHDRVVRRVLADSAGVPFLANALLRAITVGLELDDVVTPWPAPLRTLEHTLPAELPHATVAAIRVDFHRLSAGAKAVLRAAALSDGPATIGPISRATDLGVAELTRALDELEWSRWLTSDARGYTFTARLLREIVAEEMMTKGQRERMRLAMAPPGASSP